MAKTTVVGLKTQVKELQKDFPFQAKDIPPKFDLDLKVGDKVCQIMNDGKKIPLTFIGFHDVSQEFSFGFEHIAIPVFTNSKDEKLYGSDISWYHCEN